MRSAHCRNADRDRMFVELLLACATQLAEGAPPVREKRRSGAWSPVYATPASKKGDTSTGTSGDGINPNSGDPRSGMRNSVLATTTRVPNSRSSSGQLFGAVAF